MPSLFYSSKSCEKLPKYPWDFLKITKRPFVSNVKYLVYPLLDPQIPKLSPFKSPNAQATQENPLIPKIPSPISPFPHLPGASPVSLLSPTTLPPANHHTPCWATTTTLSLTFLGSPCNSSNRHDERTKLLFYKLEGYSLGYQHTTLHKRISTIQEA